MATTVPDTFTLDNGRFFQFGRHSFAAEAVTDALEVKTIYDVRDFESILVRIRNTDGADSLDFYVDGSVLQTPDDTSPTSDWFTVDDSDGNALTNIALANSTDDNRVIDVSNLAFLRVKTENTTPASISTVAIDANASVKRVS